MLNSGLKPIKKDHRDYSFHRTFGSAAPETFADSLNLDAGLTNFDQDEASLSFNPPLPNLPFGCTGFAQSDLCADEDNAIYNPLFTYDQTLTMEGASEGVGCDIRDSLNSTIVYGVQRDGETPAQALSHRRGAYYTIEQGGGLDWFDSIRSCLSLNRRSISVGTPWYNSFQQPENGIVVAPNSWDTTFAPFHNWKVCGWKTINGVPYLIGKSWQGPKYADGGFCYFPREIINQLMTIDGTGAFTLTPYTNQMAQTVILTLWEYVASYMRMISAKIGS